MIRTTRGENSHNTGYDVAVQPHLNASMSAESSLDLLERARAGDRPALEALVARYLPRLRRWAGGRLPPWARDLSDTQDLVQDTVIQAMKHIGTFEPRGEGALQAYLRQAVMNRIRTELRRLRRRPAATTLDTALIDGAPSPLERAIGSEAIDRYERALSRLRAQDRDAIIARVEMGLTNTELMHMLGKPTANAARMAVERALFRLAHEMRRADAAPPL